MGSLTARGRAAVVVAFVLSAAAASGAAVALVKAADDERTPGTTLPRVQPTLVTEGSATPTPSAAPTQTSGTPTPAASASTTASPAASASARPSAGTTARPATYLSAKADLIPVSGSAYRLVVRASDGNDAVVLSKVTWGDGSSAAATSGTACSATPGGDCRVFSLSHTYAQSAQAVDYPITVLVTAGKEKVVLTLNAGVSAKPASPSPAASATPTSSPSAAP